MAPAPPGVTPAPALGGPAAPTMAAPPPPTVVAPPAPTMTAPSVAAVAAPVAPAPQDSDIVVTGTDDAISPVEGEIISVPVAGLVNDLYISAGASFGVRTGEYFLAYNPTVRMIAVLRVTSAQERMSAVQLLAQLASLRQGDKVRRISSRRAASFRRQILALSSDIPPLSSDVVVEPAMQTIANSIGTAAAGAPAPATPPPTARPAAAAAAAPPPPASVGATATTPRAPAAPPPTPRPAAAAAAVPPLPAATPPAPPAVPATTPPAPATPPVPAAPRPATPVAATPQPPAAPAAPSADAVPAPERVAAELEGSTVVVKWNPVSSKVPLAGYLVYRAFPGDDVGAPLNGSPTRDTVWRDRTAKEGTTYMYWVVAQTLEGRQSPASSRSKVEIPKTGGVVPFF